MMPTAFAWVSSSASPVTARRFVDGTLIVNGEPCRDRPASTLLASADLPLTSVDPASILVLTLNMGVVETTLQIPVTSIEGRVLRLL